MLMVVLGAGASYDSSSEYTPAADEVFTQRREKRLPLASQLFELRETFAIAAQSLPRCQIPVFKLRNRPAEISVEQQL
jgi:hypothetical protein